MIDCPALTPAAPTTISHQMFRDACVAGNPINPIQYFDNYSWRSFLALVWPAKQGERGRPDSSLPLDAPGRPTVFETFKAEWEVFQPNERDRTAWNDYGGRSENPCELDNIVFGDVVLAAFSKVDNVIQPGSGGPLLAQNSTYVRYSAGFNQKHFQHMLLGKFYLKRNLQNFTPFPVGAISIKSAWIDMDGIERPERFHTRDAWLFNLRTLKCEKRRVALVGLHIVAKTPTRPQWIWSTFEHVDNVPGPQASAPFTFNNGRDDEPMPTSNPLRCPCPPVAPQPAHKPYNVERTKPIHQDGSHSTAKTNEKYRALLAQQYPNSPWKNYQLVMTQWPIVGSRPDLDGSPGNTFPGTGLPPYTSTAFTNTTMETFQSDISGGCMACHNHARYDPVERKGADFVVSLLTRAFSPDLAGGLPPSDGLRRLLDIKNRK
jgi:hypothetical protein